MSDQRVDELECRAQDVKFEIERWIKRNLQINLDSSTGRRIISFSVVAQHTSDYGEQATIWIVSE